LLQEKTKMAKSYKAKIEELELEAIETQESLAINMQEHEAKLSEINHELSMERTKAENHWADLEQARSKSSKQEELRKVEMKLLEESVKAAKAQTRSKEDEFRKMRNGEMKLAKEKARKLEEKVAEMEKVCEETEMDAAMIVDDMNKKMVKAAEKHAKLEEEKCAIMNESRKAIEALEGKIANFENDFSSLKKELAVRSEKLAERDARIEGMMKAKKAQDEDVESWRNDLDTLINAYEKCKIDHTATVQRIQGDYDDFKTKAQSDIAVFQKDYETLQALAAETEEKYEQQSTELSETKTALDDRTRVLGEMIECQKALEEELKEARNMIAELQDVSDSFNKQNEDYRNRYLSLQLQMEKDLNHHLDEVERKNNLTVELERKIKKVDKELVEVRAELKATEELRAENYLLKDKVDRQENFLKRKLEKEKKQRLVPRSIGSPPRTNPPRSRSVTRRPSDIPQKSSQSKPKKSRSRSHSTNRRSSSSGDELEELLM
jgi:septal ring factor EnvC (AmiA/AmiB activator)